jgi:DNA segregation ATPase FtsK/SpoIIIE-like protein
VRISRTHEELNAVLDELIVEYKSRDRLLYSKELEKATDAKDVIKLYPAYRQLFQPVFLIIDEYARFADDKEIQMKVMELVESAGYVNVHLIISSQRPDARTVLPARVKGNLLARICFTTADANNSIVILDQEGAEKLGEIPGRALLRDKGLNMIQVPCLEMSECEELLKKYSDNFSNTEKEESFNDSDTFEMSTRQINHELTDKISSLFSGSVGQNGVYEQFESCERVQSSHETTVLKWKCFTGREGKR